MKRTTIRVFTLALVVLLLGTLILPAMALPETGVGEEALNIGAAAENWFSEFIPSDIDFGEIAGSLLSISSPDDVNAMLAPYQTDVPIILFLLAAVAALLCLFGYRLIRLSLAVGGLVGGWMFGSLAYTWVGQLGLFDPTALPGYVPYLVCAGCALVAVVLVMRLYKFGIFLLAATGTYIFLGSVSFFAGLVDQLLGDTLEARQLLARIVVAILVGLFAIWIEKAVLILVTSFAGGFTASFALFLSLQPRDTAINTTAELAIGFVLACIGVIVQFSTTRRRK